MGNETHYQTSRQKTYRKVKKKNHRELLNCYLITELGNKSPIVLPILGDENACF